MNTKWNDSKKEVMMLTLFSNTSSLYLSIFYYFLETLSLFPLHKKLMKWKLFRCTFNEVKLHKKLITFSLQSENNLNSRELYKYCGKRLCWNASGSHSSKIKKSRIWCWKVVHIAAKWQRQYIYTCMSSIFLSLLTLTFSIFT